MHIPMHILVDDKVGDGGCYAADSGVRKSSLNQKHDGQMNQDDCGQSIGLEQNMLRMLRFGNVVPFVTLVQSVVDNRMPTKCLAGASHFMHPELMPVPLEETAVYHPAQPGHKLGQQRNHIGFTFHSVDRIEVRFAPTEFTVFKYIRI
jgi:hypothetical protein